MKKTNEEYISECKKVYNTPNGVFENVFDYSLCNYSGSLNKIKVICKKHGVFEVKAGIHLNKNRGCQKCYTEGQIKGIDTFIVQANKKHNFLYEYDSSIYLGAHKKLEIVCKIHGLFLQTPNSHLRGSGCPDCGNISCGYSKKISHKEFILKAIKMHKNKYDYDLVKYKNSKKKIKIVCQEHGLFLQTPNSHLNGNGCPICAGEKNYENVPTYLYYIQIKNQYKIGVVQKKNKTLEKCLQHRYSHNLKDYKILNYVLFKNGSISYGLEQMVIKKFKGSIIKKQDKILKDGHTETFIKNIFHKTDLFESFKQLKKIKDNKTFHAVIKNALGSIG